MTTNSPAITKIKQRWERAEFWLEVASVVGGLMVGVGLWIEGETTIGQRLVTGGVAMEVICAWWVLVASRKLQNVLETEFETLRLETAEANVRAAETLQKQTQAALQLEQLKQRAAWRSVYKSDAFKDALKDQPRGTILEILHPKDDAEAHRFAVDISVTLLNLGWKVDTLEAINPIDSSPYDKLPSVVSVGGNTVGITIRASGDISDETDERTPLVALKNAFFASLGNITISRDDSLPVGGLKIIVGAKP